MLIKGIPKIWGSDLLWFLRSGGLKFCCQGAILDRHVGYADTKMFSRSRRHAQWVCFCLIPRDTLRVILAAFTANIPANIHWIGNNFIHRFGKFVFLVFSLWTFEFLIIKGDFYVDHGRNYTTAKLPPRMRVRFVCLNYLLSIIWFYTF